MSTYTPVRSRFRSAITAIPSDLACAIRPARPGDEALVRVMLERCSGEDLRQRCHGSDKGFPVSFARRVARCEDPGEIALIALTEDGEVVGIVHAIADLAPTCW